MVPFRMLAENSIRAAALSLLTVLAACGLPRNVFVLQSEDGHAGAITISNPGGATTLTATNSAVGIDAPGTAPGAVFMVTEEQVASTFGKVLAAEPRPSQHFVLWFETGRTTLDVASRAQLPMMISAAKGVAAPYITVSGHTDTTATAAFNDPLALARAVAIRNALVAAGLDTRQIEVASYGSNDPLIPTGPNVAEPRNRRVEVTVR
jgi:OOP family OmpA-OmpF porin